MGRTARDWIERLGLLPHPEGGYYRETYRATATLPVVAAAGGNTGSRAVSTAIYFLLPGDQVSALHRIASDELWHFHAGRPLVLSLIGVGGDLTRVRLGPDPDAGEVFQAVVPAGTWFGGEVEGRDGFALAGCTVAPGFDFADFELGERETLLALYPRHRAVIERLTRAR